MNLQETMDSSTELRLGRTRLVAGKEPRWLYVLLHETQFTFYLASKEKSSPPAVRLLIKALYHTISWILVTWGDDEQQIDEQIDDPKS